MKCFTVICTYEDPTCAITFSGAMIVLVDYSVLVDLFILKPFAAICADLNPS